MIGGGGGGVGIKMIMALILFYMGAVVTGGTAGCAHFRYSFPFCSKLNRLRTRPENKCCCFLPPFCMMDSNSQKK